MKTGGRVRSGVLAMMVGLAGCASLPEGKTLDPQDPFERFNRASFSFNDGLDHAIVKPVTQAYQVIAPDPVRTGIANFFGNLSDIPTALNHLLQGHAGATGTHLGRVAVNSTIGLLGLFDVATPIGLARQRTDFGETLGVWGVGTGPYLVLPLFGPSSARDAPGLAIDWAMDPLRLPAPAARNALVASRFVDEQASLLPAEKIIDEAALDRYLFVRDAYLARRRSQVEDGKQGSPPAGEPPSATVQDRP